MKKLTFVNLAALFTIVSLSLFALAIEPSQDMVNAPAGNSDWTMLIMVASGFFVTIFVGLSVMFLLKPRNFPKKQLPTKAQVRQEVHSSPMYRIMSSYERDIYERRLIKRHEEQRRILREFDVKH